MFKSSDHPGLHILPKLTLYQLECLNKRLFPIDHLFNVPGHQKMGEYYCRALWAVVVESYQLIVNLQSEQQLDEVQNDKIIDQMKYYGGWLVVG